MSHFAAAFAAASNGILLLLPRRHGTYTMSLIGYKHYNKTY